MAASLFLRRANMIPEMTPGGIVKMAAELDELRREIENLKRLNALYLQQLSRTSIRRWGLAK